MKKTKKIMKLKLTLILMLTAIIAIAQTNSALSEKERKFASDYLATTREEFLNSVTGLSEAQLRFKADSSKWSIMECAEHIALAEQGIFSIIQGQLKQSAQPEKRTEIKVAEQDIINRLTNRKFKAQSPEVIKPSGRFPTIESIKSVYEKQRANCISYLSTTQDDLHNHFWQHPATGTIDLYQSIILLAAHSKRHTLQIEEVKSSSNFPK
jgi:uncharacterized damage-inducible protein DinB